MTTVTATLRTPSGPGRAGASLGDLLALMADNPRVRYRLRHGELPAWMFADSDSNRRRPSRHTRTGRAPHGAPQMAQVRKPNPGVHRKPHRRSAWLLAGYTFAAVAGAVVSHVLGALVWP